MIPKEQSCIMSEQSVCPGALVLAENEFGADAASCLDRISRMCSGDTVMSVALHRTGTGRTEYNLTVSTSGIVVEASDAGIFPSLSTLQALICGGSLPICRITDRARFEHRGYMQDDARHFQGADAAIEILEIMFRFKMNVFHWHLSDDQGFRLDMPGYERLSEHASHRKSSHAGGYLKNSPDNVPYSALYTREDIDRVLTAARERGIKVIPEMDMPGHFSAILSAYPEFTCDGVEIDVPGRYGVLENTLCLGKKDAWEFAKKLALDTARYLGADTIHIGFDEIKTNKMCACPDCQREAKRRGLKSPVELIPLFRNEVRDFLDANGIKCIAWDDENSLPGVDEKITFMHWRPESNRKAAERINNGQKAIMADFYHYYTDYPYCMTPLKKTYRYDPVIPGVKSLENIVGVETPFWAEFLRRDDKRDMNGFYRIAAVAENAWNTPAGRPSYEDFMKELREREDYYFGKRLDVPESILNPAFPTRLARLIKCLYRNSDLEAEIYAEMKEKNHG